jgi:receptor protein-tyrosine kinase
MTQTDSVDMIQDHVEIDVRRYIRLLKKRAWIFGLALIGTISVAVLLTARADRVYQVHATLFVGQRQISVAQLASGVQVANLSAQLLRSYAEIIQSRSIAERAVSHGGLTLTPAQVLGGLRAEPILDTQVIRLIYRASDPLLAQRAANAVAETFVAEIGRLETPDAAGSEPAVRVSIIDRAVASSSPVSPSPRRNIALAVVLGLLAGGGIAVLVDRLDVSVKNPEELEQMGIPVLGSVPSLDTHGEDVYLERDTQGLGGEAFRKLRTSIGFAGLESPVKTLLVTSSVAAEGKTTLALNLATAYAMGGFRTLLLEADLRRPSLHRMFGMNGTRGLTTTLVGVVPLSEAVLHTDIRNFSVMLAGAIPPNPVELLSSEQMSEVVERLRRMFDIIVVDSPPIIPVADPAALAGRCDGVVVVARAGKTDRRRLVDAAQIVHRAGGRLLGVVLNFQRPGDSPYDYQYYQYGYRAENLPSAERA